MTTKKKKQVALEEIFEDESPEEKLYKVRQDILVLTALSKSLAVKVLESLKEKGTKRGGRFKISLRQTLRVTDHDTAFKWAAERNVMDINTTKAMRLIRREFVVPEGFAVQQTEYLSMRTARNDETNEDETEADS